MSNNRQSELTITDGIEKVLESMRNNYKDWSNACKKAEENRPRTELEIKYPESNKPNPQIRKDMIKEYCEGLEVLEGSRYYKIISTHLNGQKTVCGFIAKAGDKKFKEGDMLKPDGWASPARNFARGNVFEPIGEVRWTGIG